MSNWIVKARHGDLEIASDEYQYAVRRDTGHTTKLKGGREVPKYKYYGYYPTLEQVATALVERTARTSVRGEEADALREQVLPLIDQLADFKREALELLS